MAEFASKGVAGAGLGTGIAGLALGVLNGGLGNLFNGTGVYNRAVADSSEKTVTRYEMDIENKLQDALMKNSLLEANIYTDQKLADVYARLDGKIRVNEAAIAQQAILNATENATIACLQAQVAQLQGMTQVYVKASSVSPEPMSRYNSWTAPTSTGSTS